MKPLNYVRYMCIDSASGSAEKDGFVSEGWVRLRLLSQPDRTAKQSNQDSDLIFVRFRSLDFLPCPNRQPPQLANWRKILSLKTGQSRGNMSASALIFDKTLWDNNRHVLSISFCSRANRVLWFYSHASHTPISNSRDRLNQRQVSIRPLYWLCFFCPNRAFCLALFVCQTK